MSLGNLPTNTLAVALAVGGILNLFALRATRDRYRRWGFVHRLRFLMVALYLIAAILVIRSATFVLGSATALMLMAAIIGAASRYWLDHQDHFELIGAAFDGSLTTLSS